MRTGPGSTVLRLDGVSVQRDGRRILADVDLEIGAADRWVVLGPNGSGKTTLARVAAWQTHPSRGRVQFGGLELGRCDARAVRQRIAFISAAFADRLRGGLASRDVVMCARHGSLEPWWHQYDDADRARAVACLDDVGLAHVAEQPFATLSSGERQRVLLARALMAEPALLVLDEPCAGLDLRGREELLARLDALALPPLLLVTHHLEEIPAAATHALLLRDGRTVASGPIRSTLCSDALSACMGLGVRVARSGGRWTATADRLHHGDEPGT